MLSLRVRGRSGVLRLALAALAVGAVVLGVVLIVSGHGSRGSARSVTAVSGNQPLVQSAPSPKGDAAVTSSLRHGVMVVAIDQPSSGLFTEQNASIAQGATVAVDELNAAGGLPRHIRIKLVPQDLEGLSPAAVEGRLHSEAAAALILPCDTESQLSLAAGAARYGTLLLAPCNPDPSAGRRYSTYWPVGMEPSDEATGLASFMHTVGYGSVFIINAPGNHYAELMTSYFRAAAQRKGIRIVGSASVAMTMGDVSSLAHTIEAVNPRPSTIFTALPPPLVNQLAAGLEAQGVTQNVAGTSALDTRLTLTRNVGALEDAVFPSYGFPRESAQAHRFASDYRQRFGGEPVGSFPGLGFETIRLLETAARDARSAEPSAIQRALSRGLSLEGVALAERTYQPGGDHNPTGTVAIEKIVSRHLEQVFAATP
ncbi:MAG TPA: ABC transporter substrate-binding protein [Solirubrobacteraceae bacterium]|nr:ABC transporter substrate-binding protein [Solirubrobacteraceae bacterium]